MFFTFAGMEIDNDKLLIYYQCLRRFISRDTSFNISRQVTCSNSLDATGLKGFESNRSMVSVECLFKTSKNLGNISASSTNKSSSLLDRV